MFKEDSQGCLYYESKKTKISYSLLEGITNNNHTSDIVFIFRDATPKETENDYYGEVINWCYDGFNNLDFMEKQIKEYEKNFEKEK